MWAPEVFSETICGNPVITVDASGAPPVSLIKVSSVVVGLVDCFSNSSQGEPYCSEGV